MPSEQICETLPQLQEERMLLPARAQMKFGQEVCLKRDDGVQLVATPRSILGEDRSTQLDKRLAGEFDSKSLFFL